MFSSRIFCINWLVFPPQLGGQSRNTSPAAIRSKTCLGWLKDCQGEPRLRLQKISDNIFIDQLSMIPARSGCSGVVPVILVVPASCVTMRRSACSTKVSEKFVYSTYLDETH